MRRASGGVVGVVLKGFPRLSETFITRELVMLEARGVALHLFAMRDPGESRVHDEAKRVRADVTYLPDDLSIALGTVIAANARVHRQRPGVYRAALRFALGRSIGERSFATLKRFLQAGYLVDRALPGTGVIHLHAQFGHDPTTVAFFAAWLSGLRYSFSAHAKDIYAQDRRWLGEKVEQARFVVTCTEHNRAHLAALRPHTPVLRSYHGLRLTEFRRDAGASSGSEIPQLLSVGRLVEKKGFSTLLRSLAKLAARGVEFRFTLVGDGPLRDRLDREIRTLGLADRVTRIGAMTHGELISLYREADLFVLPCEVQDDGDRDGIPNVIVEALAMEVPVVSTSVSGIPECVEHGVSGLLVPERDAAALTEAIATLLADTERRRRMGRAGREKIEREFDAARNIGEIEAALRESLAAAGAPGVEREPLDSAALLEERHATA